MIERTDCCIAGGGPAGMMLAYLLARQGVQVVLLEQHRDFDRDFRGDTLHASVLDILDELGLGEALHKLPHSEMRQMRGQASGGSALNVDFRRLPSHHPYVMMLPQAEFLDFMAEQAKRLPTFHLQMGARVEALIEE